VTYTVIEKSIDAVKHATKLIKSDWKLKNADDFKSAAYANLRVFTIESDAAQLTLSYGQCRRYHGN
jgi:hypothetical protein